MTEAALLSLCDAQARLIDDLLSDRDPPRDMPREAEQIARLLPRLIGVCRETGHALESLRTALFLAKIKKTEPIGLIARETLPRMISTMERVRRWGRLASQAGSPPDRLAEFEEVADRFRRATEEFLMRWPLVNLDRLAESAAAHERGETQSARDAFDELLHRAARAGRDTDRRVEPVGPSAP